MAGADDARNANPPDRPTMPDWPSGTVTFLFTDIEGSTRLWERHPAEMHDALACHDALLHDVVARNGGVVFKTVGDAFCAVFQSTYDALTAACASQRVLSAEAWPPPVTIRARMALHTAEAEPRGNDYFGPALNRVARLLAAGHGGQVLLSLAAQQQVCERLPPGVSLRDMGERWLKDLVRPERVFQLVDAELASEFPPLKTLDAREHNLPIQPTSFVGREREMQEIRTLLASSRMVTLTGAGGAGKTRLALQIGAECIDDYAGGAWLAELAPLGDAALVPQAVATVLGVKEHPGDSLSDTLVRELADRELLLILDNCEHVIAACAQLCQALVTACPRVRILATSREALRVGGEATYRMPALAVSEPTATASAAEVARYPAVQLFVDRARAVRPSFSLDERNARAVASICHQLDGIPLAIELAAARMRALSVDEVHRRLDRRFRLLTGGARTAMPRQQTLRATIDWSYDLLDAREQALLGRLAVFANGWTLDAAERVCSDAAVPTPDVLDLLTSLADKSLVLADERGDAMRYRLLETVRQYAQDRLEQPGDADRWRAAHLAYFVALAEESEPHANSAEQQAWLDRLDVEHDNLRFAIARSVAPHGDALGGLRLAGALWWFWQVRGYQTEGRDHLAALLAATSYEHDVAVRAKALSGAGMLAWQQGDYAGARALIERSLALRRTLDDSPGVARSLSNLGILARDQGDYDESVRLQQESLAIRRALGDRWGTAATLCNLGLVSLDRADFPSARSMFEECIPLFRESGDQRGVAASLLNLGEVAIAQADYRSAKGYYDEALATFRALGDRRGISITLTGLGQIAGEERNFAEARALQAESLALKMELGDRRGISISLEALAYVESACGEHETAARLWGHAEALREAIEIPLTPAERDVHERHIAASRAAMDGAAFRRAWQEGRGMASAEVLGSVVQQGRANPAALP